MNAKLFEIFSTHWRKILDKAINQTLVACGLLGAFILPFTLYRSVQIGLYQEVIVHLIIYPIILLTAIFQRHINFLTKVTIVFIPLVVITGAGLMSWGFVGAGFSWSLITLLFVAVFFGTRYGIYTALSISAFLALVGYWFANSTLSINLDINEYAISGVSWGVYITTYVIHSLLILIIINSLYQAVKLLVIDLEKEKLAVQEMASTDPLTKAYNLRIARERIELSLARAKRHPHLNIYLIFVDLNDFKLINDTYGHSVGDRVLTTITNRLQQTMREEDMVARIGGDEFLILIESDNESRDIETILTRLKDAIGRPISNEYGPIKPSASLGYAHRCKTGSHGDDISTDELIKAADKDMYLRKAIYRKNEGSHPRARLQQESLDY